MSDPKKEEITMKDLKKQSELAYKSGFLSGKSKECGDHQIEN